MSMRLMATWVAVSAFGLLSGCSNSELTKSWKSPAFNRAPFKKVMILGVAKRPEVRRMYEDAFVSQLKAKGVEGVASYTLIPDLGKVNRDDVKRVAIEAGADAVLVTRLVKFDSQTYAASDDDERVEMYLGLDAPGTYTPSQQGYAVETVVLQNQLFDGQSAQPVWSGTTQSFDPKENLEQTVCDLATLIVRTLARQKLI